MRKLILALTVAAFTVAVQAAETTPVKEKAAGCSGCAAMAAKQGKAEGKAKGCCAAKAEKKLASPKAAGR